MSRQPAYRSPAAFRRALTDRLRTASRDTPWSLPQLQRQIAYDRLLERLYLVEEAWIGPSRPIAEAASSVRIPVVATVGTTPWAEFHVDIVGTNVRMTSEPELVPPLAQVAMPDIEQHGYRAYPLVDHVADKVAAIIERHGEPPRPSTRYKDLVDLVAVVTRASVPAAAQATALRSEAARRGIELPTEFGVPDRMLWERGYAAEANRSVLPIARSLDEALAVVRPFVNPLLTGAATGQWEPVGARWTGTNESP